MTRLKIRVIQLLAISPIFWFFLFFLFHIIVLDPKAREVEKVLQIELSYLIPPSQAQLYESGAMRKTNQASVYNRYSTLMSPEEVFKYYDGELARYGWQFLNQQDISLEVVGRDYCKGNYTASLNYYGIGHAWKYELWLSAGQTSDCEMLKGGGFIFIPFSDLWFLLACSTSLSIYAIIIGLASFRMSHDEFNQFISNIARVPTSIWRTRFGSALILITSLFGITLSVYKIVLYILNW